MVERLRRAMNKDPDIPEGAPWKDCEPHVVVDELKRRGMSQQNAFQRHVLLLEADDQRRRDEQSRLPHRNTSDRWSYTTGSSDASYGNGVVVISSESELTSLSDEAEIPGEKQAATNNRSPSESELSSLSDEAEIPGKKQTATNSGNLPPPPSLEPSASGEKQHAGNLPPPPSLTGPASGEQQDARCGGTLPPHPYSLYSPSHGGSVKNPPERSSVSTTVTRKTRKAPLPPATVPPTTVPSATVPSATVPSAALPPTMRLPVYPVAPRTPIPPRQPPASLFTLPTPPTTGTKRKAVEDPETPSGRGSEEQSAKRAKVNQGPTTLTEDIEARKAGNELGSDVKQLVVDTILADPHLTQSTLNIVNDDEEDDNIRQIQVNTVSAAIFDSELPKRGNDVTSLWKIFGSPDSAQGPAKDRRSMISAVFDAMQSTFQGWRNERKAREASPESRRVSPESYGQSPQSRAPSPESHGESPEL